VLVAPVGTALLQSSRMGGALKLEDAANSRPWAVEAHFA